MDRSRPAPYFTQRRAKDCGADVSALNHFPPFSSYLRLTTRALHWDRRRPALRTYGVEYSARSSHPAVLEAGGTPALPVRSSSGQAKLTAKGSPNDDPKRPPFQPDPPRISPVR